MHGLLWYGDLTIDPDSVSAVHIRRPEGLPDVWVEVFAGPHRHALCTREGVTAENAESVAAEIIGAMARKHQKDHGT